jgi:hypothetical protein
MFQNGFEETVRAKAFPHEAAKWVGQCHDDRVHGAGADFIL